MHETGRAGGDAGAGRAASSGRRWAGTGDPRADAGLPVRGGRHRDAQPGDRGTDRRRPPDRRGGPPLWAHRDLRVDASRPGPPGRFGRPGRPPKLTGRQVAQAQVWAGSGWTQQAIADQLKVARSVISELLARVGPAPVQDALTPTGNTDIESESPETVAGPDDTIAATSDIEPAAPEPAVTEPAVTEPVVTEPVVTEPVVAGFTGTPVGSARATAGVYRCRYAGAMLLYPYLHQVGAEGVFATLTGAPARRYNDLAVFTTATVGFALGVDTVEGTKHLRRDDAGAAVGLGVAPQLTTLRARLSAPVSYTHLTLPT